MKDRIFNDITLPKECTVCKYHPSNSATKTDGTQPTNVQQLQAKIVARVDKFCHCSPVDLPKEINSLVKDLRQLSAVQ